MSIRLKDQLVKITFEINTDCLKIEGLRRIFT